MKHDLLPSLIFLLVAVILILAKKVYFSITAVELKRRAEKGDAAAVAFFKVVSYGASLRALLWAMIGLSLSASFIFLSESISFLPGLFILALIIYLIFSLLPATKPSRLSVELTKLITPLIAWLLKYTHEPLGRLSLQLEPHYKLPRHTGVYERQDLIDLISHQQKQADSRLSPDEVQLLKRAISFNDKKVSDVLVPKKQVKTVLASDTLGPVLINEMHENAQADVLVKDTPKGSVVGTLSFKDLSIKSHGKVSDSMNDKLYYLNQDDSLNEALHAFFVTNQNLFIVVDSADQYVGVVALEAILKQLFGHIPGKDLEAYLDSHEVAARHQAPEASPEASVKTDE